MIRSWKSYQSRLITRSIRGYTPLLVHTCLHYHCLARKSQTGKGSLLYAANLKICCSCFRNCYLASGNI